MSEETYVSSLPPCDICTTEGRPTTLASYDGRTRQGPWAYMCHFHFNFNGVGLGTGYGQRLILRSDNAEA